MKNVVLFGGSFCPVHSGHIMVASYVAQYCPDVDEVWLVLSPRNPLKDRSLYMLTAERRMELLELAVRGRTGLRVCDVELTMPQPSYTVNTLRKLSGLYPDCRFRWLIGSDNIAELDRWRESGEILRDYGILVYPRPGYAADKLSPGLKLVDAPVVEVSSTMIREGLSRGLDMGAFMPKEAYDRLISFLRTR